MDTNSQIKQLVEEAKSLYRSEDYTASEHKLSQALELAPDDPDLLFFRSNIRERAGDIAGAITDLSQVIDTSSDADVLIDAYWKRKILNEEAGRHEETLSDLNWLIEHRSYDIDHSMRAREHSKAGKLTEAIADLTMAFSLAPSNLLYLYRRAHLYYSIKAYGRTIYDCTTIIRENTNNNLKFRNIAETHYLRAQAYFMIDDIDPAIQDANETRKLRNQPAFQSLAEFMDEFGYLKSVD